MAKPFCSGNLPVAPGLVPISRDLVQTLKMTILIPTMKVKTLTQIPIILITTINLIRKIALTWTIVPIKTNTYTIPRSSLAYITNIMVILSQETMVVFRYQSFRRIWT